MSEILQIQLRVARQPVRLFWSAGTCHRFHFHCGHERTNGVAGKSKLRHAGAFQRKRLDRESGRRDFLPPLHGSPLIFVCFL